MLSLRITAALGVGIALYLLMIPILNLHGGVSWGWLFSSRVEKKVIFEVYGKPFAEKSWPARWGENRPEKDRPHEIISEIGIKVRHQTREGAVILDVIGDSEAEVDSVIATLVSEFERTYDGFENPDDQFSTR